MLKRVAGCYYKRDVGHGSRVDNVRRSTPIITINGNIVFNSIIELNVVLTPFFWYLLESFEYILLCRVKFEVKFYNLVEDGLILPSFF